MARRSDATRHRQKAERLREQLAQLGPLMRGSLVRSRGKCRKPNCRCARGHLHAWWALTFQAGGPQP